MPPSPSPDCPRCGTPVAVFLAGVCPRCALAGEGAAEELEPGAVPGYCLREKIGEGGMGEVFLAEQVKPVPREVALKRLKHAADGGEWLTRFQHEMEALALLDHRNVATVFDAGVSEDGRPFYTMELVEGLPLTLFCDRGQLSFGHRLRLMKVVCDTVDYAHRRGVWHGDLKPSNILAAREPDGEVEVKLIDFGVRRASLAGNEGGARFTAMFTPGYASPESRASGAWDSRSDVYSLGVVLAELLGGRPPGTPGTVSAWLAAAPLAKDIASARRATPRALRKLLREDVDWIVARATAADPAARYRSAAEMADDLTAVLGGFPVRARAASVCYSVGKFIRRERRRLVLAGVAGAVMLSAALAAILHRRTAERSREELERMEAETGRAVRQTELMQQLVHGVAMISRAPDQATRDAGLTHVLASTAEEADRAGGEGDAQAALVLLSASAAAAAAFERQDLAIAQWRRALVWLDKSGIAPGNAQRTGVEGALARSLMAVGETGEAVQLLTRLAAPENLALLPARNRVDVLMDLARAHFAGREFQSAAQWAEQALAAAEAAFGPEHPAALHTALLLGKALTECQRYPGARAALVRAADGLNGTSDKAAADEAAQWLEDVEKVLRDRAGE